MASAVTQESNAKHGKIPPFILPIVLDALEEDALTTNVRMFERHFATRDLRRCSLVNGTWSHLSQERLAHHVIVPGCETNAFESFHRSAFMPKRRTPVVGEGTRSLRIVCKCKECPNAAFFLGLLRQCPNLKHLESSGLRTANGAGQIVEQISQMTSLRSLAFDCHRSADLLSLSHALNQLGHLEEFSLGVYARDWTQDTFTQLADRAFPATFVQLTVENIRVLTGTFRWLFGSAPTSDAMQIQEIRVLPRGGITPFNQRVDPDDMILPGLAGLERLAVEEWVSYVWLSAILARCSMLDTLLLRLEFAPEFIGSHAFGPALEEIPESLPLRTLILVHKRPTLEISNLLYFDPHLERVVRRLPKLDTLDVIGIPQDPFSAYLPKTCQLCLRERKIRIFMRGL